MIKFNGLKESQINKILEIENFVVYLIKNEYHAYIDYKRGDYWIYICDFCGVEREVYCDDFSGLMRFLKEKAAKSE